MQDASSQGDEALNRWYLSVVWRVIERMQSNAGFLIRFSSDPFTRKGARPPFYGFIVMVVVLGVAFVLLPIINFVLVAVPFSILLDFDVGGPMRLAWCNSMEPFQDWTWLRAKIIATLVLCAAFLQLVMGSVRQILGLRSLKFVFALRNCLLLAASCLVALIVLAWGAIGLQLFSHHAGHTCPIPEVLDNGLYCLDDVSLHLATSDTQFGAHPEWNEADFHSIWPLWLTVNATVAILGILGSCLRWRLLIIRGGHIAGLLLPMWAALAATMIARWRIFGLLEHWRFPEHWRLLSIAVFCLALLVVPWYGKLRQVVHVYYRRSLRRAFYSEGEDVDLTAAQEELCPNIIVSATLVDYCRTFDPEERHFSEFFFTPRRMGGERTGFIDVPRDLRLSRVMAISGAASDAFMMTQMDSLWVRVTLLALFNLFMGDYIPFRSNKRQGHVTGTVQAAIVNVIFLAFFALLFVADPLSAGEGREHSGAACERSFTLARIAVAMLSTLLILSFFASFSGLRWILSSSIIRHLHMAMMHYHTSEQPPLRLHLNDGGLVECLGLISLLRRRCGVMLVTDATADFKMELVCLRQSMKMAEAEHLCTFFDPQDPRCSAEPVLQAFAASQATFCRVGVLYDCWPGADAEGGCPAGQRRTGEIFFIRMRLLDNHLGRQVQERITEDEVMLANQRMATLDHGASMLREDVGGCCCDCCHTKFNCGCMGRFPDIANSNQFLTSTQFALLCRLGYEISGEAIDAISKHQCI